jgi:formate dehydrogenase subunit gamma
MIQAPTDTASRTDAAIARHKDTEGPLLPILQDLQAEFGHIPREALPRIAEALNLSRAEVHGVVSFYHDFTDSPRGRVVVRLCRAEACQAVGGRALAEAVRQSLGIGWGETTPDGSVTLEAVYCLGLCACGPAGVVGESLAGRLDPDRVTQLLAEAAR